MDEKVKIRGRMDSEGLGNTDHYQIALSVEISLRDLFAAFALAGLMQEGLRPDVAAKEAYESADAAINARAGDEDAVAK